MFITFALITLLGALGMLLQKNVIVAGLSWPWARRAFPSASA